MLAEAQEGEKEVCSKRSSSPFYAGHFQAASCPFPAWPWMSPGSPLFTACFYQSKKPPEIPGGLFSRRWRDPDILMEQPG